jgi:spore maturation protein CgeD
VSPAVSVLLTSYNRPRYLPQAVESVFAQTMSDWELLILDDNSSDPLVAAYLGTIWQFPQVVIVKSAVSEDDRPATCRYAVQINAGLKLATGRHVTYLCDDDWYAPRRLEVMSGMLDADPSLGVVYARQAVTGENGAVITHRHAEPVMTDAYCRVDHSSVMHTAEAGQKAGGWDESAEHWRIGDAVFWRRLHAAGYSFHLAPGGEPLDFHRDHGRGVNKLGGPY